MWVYRLSLGSLWLYIYNERISDIDLGRGMRVIIYSGIYYHRSMNYGWFFVLVKKVNLIIYLKLIIHYTMAIKAKNLLFVW